MPDTMPERCAECSSSRIANGEWKVGQRIPSIEALCEEYDVARNTVRQALELLKSEGLIGGGRGLGTFVRQSPALSALDDDLKNAISDPLTLGPDQSIQVLKRLKKVSVPEDLVRGLSVYSDYTLIRKLHHFRDQPFALMDIYVASPIYDRFPKGHDTSIKIARLLRDQGISIAKSQLEITTRPADHEAAQLLDYSMAGSLVCMRRWRTGSYISPQPGFVQRMRPFMAHRVVTRHVGFWGTPDLAGMLI